MFVRSDSVLMAMYEEIEATPPPLPATPPPPLDDDLVPDEWYCPEEVNYGKDAIIQVYEDEFDEGPVAGKTVLIKAVSTALVNFLAPSNEESSMAVVEKPKRKKTFIFSPKSSQRLKYIGSILQRIIIKTKRNREERKIQKQDEFTLVKTKDVENLIEAWENLLICLSKEPECECGLMVTVSKDSRCDSTVFNPVNFVEVVVEKNPANFREQAKIKFPEMESKFQIESKFEQSEKPKSNLVSAISFGRTTINTNQVDNKLSERNVETPAINHTRLRETSIEKIDLPPKIESFSDQKFDWAKKYFTDKFETKKLLFDCNDDEIKTMEETEPYGKEVKSRQMVEDEPKSTTIPSEYIDSILEKKMTSDQKDKTKSTIILSEYIDSILAKKIMSDSTTSANQEIDSTLVITASNETSMSTATWRSQLNVGSKPDETSKKQHQLFPESLSTLRRSCSIDSFTLSEKRDDISYGFSKFPWQNNSSVILQSWPSLELVSTKRFYDDDISFPFPDDCHSRTSFQMEELPLQFYIEEEEDSPVRSVASEKTIASAQEQELLCRDVVLTDENKVATQNRIQMLLYALKNRFW